MQSAPNSTGEPRASVVRHELSLQSLLLIVAVGAGVWLLIHLWSILLLLTVALILAGTLAPVVTWLERRRVPRAAGIVLVLLALLAAVLGIGALAIPALIAQIADLIERAPELRDQLATQLAGIPLLASRAQAVRGADPQALLAPLGNFVLGHANTAVQVLFDGFTAVVLACYLLADHERVQGFGFALLPRRYHLRAARILLDMGVIVGGYVRGQALTSALIGTFTFIVLALAGVPNPLALAVFAAFADLIPLVGAALAVLPPALAALTRGPITAGGVLIALFLYQQVESHVFIPRVYGRILRLSPVAVLIALLIGGKLLGIMGALLALPLAAGLRVLIEDLRIELPGDQPGETTQREADAQDEAAYAALTQGVSAIEASAVATAIAEQRQEDELALTGKLESPVEESGAGDPTMGAVPPV